MTRFFTPMSTYTTEVFDMTRKLVLIALAAALGLAVTGVASAKCFNVRRGTKHADVINDPDNRDFILGFAGDDQISAAGARDVVLAGRGNDSVDGGAGFDRLRGGPGNDTLSAGDNGGILWGGDGNDTLNAGNSGRNVLHGGKGDDTDTGGSGRDRLYGGFGADTLSGGDGNGVLFALAPDGQVDNLDCGAGDHDVAWVRSTEHDNVVNCELVKTVTVGS